MTTEELKILREELNSEDFLDIPADKIIDQLKTFERGIPFVKLDRACTIGDGIKIIPGKDQQHFITSFEDVLDKRNVMKFVPASGAASRMFKELQTVISDKENLTIEDLKKGSGKGDENSASALEFINRIKSFAFFDDLNEKLKTGGKNIDELLKHGNVTDIIEYTLNPEGLNYANLPKGCIKFHSYPEGTRTAFEEHIVEAINYAAGKEGKFKIHFTISPEHTDEVKSVIDPLISKYEKKGFNFDITFSYQEKSTNTIAATKDNKPFRDENGKLVFRPGGHGALLENLNDLNGDIILIKNVDNVATDHLKETTYKFKKILGGYLVELQDEIFSFLKELESVKQDEKFLNEIEDFIKAKMEYDIPGKIRAASEEEKKKYFFDFLNRPIRVCGMVKNEGEPGGGPFWVTEKDGTLSKQVVESAQVDLNDKNQRQVWESATHFSPVDFICGVKDYKRNNFNLKDFSDPETGLITKKSFQGEELKALELPGLWNGGMANWLTVFIEVPAITFNPVKEVNDLLRLEHQPG